METLEAIATRVSVRSYRQEQISDDELATIIRAGQSAPNAGPFQISVIQKADLLKRLSGVTRTAMKNSGNAFLMERVSLPGYDGWSGSDSWLRWQACCSG